MSYLNNLRLVFSGTFQADVSTVNNDVRHFDNDTFKEVYQTPQQGNAWNGWWHPTGGAQFRLLDCTVRQVHYGDGTGAASASADPIVGALVAGSDSRVAGKLVDIDPQWQLASVIFGLQMRFVGEGDGPDFFGGSYEPAPFRDLYFGRLASSGDSGATAAFQSVLTDVAWGDAPSRFVDELRAAAHDGLLSVQLNTFGYTLDATSDRFTLGTMVGVVGPYLEGEPRSFVRGRRMTPVVYAAGPNQGNPKSGVNFFNAQVVEAEDPSPGDPVAHALVDFGNALPLADGSGALKDLGTLVWGVLLDPDTPEGAAVTEGTDALGLGGRIPYTDPGWLVETGGIWAAPVAADQADVVASRPLALIEVTSDTTGTVLVRESTDGLSVRAEQLLHRAEPGETCATTFFAAQYGEPLAGAAVEFELQPKQSGGGGSSPSDTSAPDAPIPDVNFPASALTLPTSPLTTGPDGRATLRMQTADPGRPRGYIDGQLYQIQYAVAGMPQSQMQEFDLVVLLLFSGFEAPERPTWTEDIAPIMTLYGNLYPVMSRQLFPLSDYRAVVENRELLKLAFGLPLDDPNSMPVTRDLSGAKRAAILRWLDDPRYSPTQDRPPAEAETLLDGLPPTLAARRAPAPEASLTAAADAAADPTPSLGGKAEFVRSLRRARDE